MTHSYEQADPAVWQAIHQEEARQQHNIELIASENIVSPGVRAAQGSVLTNKYSEGYPGHRYYGGNEYIDVTEQLAIDRAKALFGAEAANVQPHSGSQANMAAYRALLKDGDTVLAMDLAAGGHLSHGAPISFSGQEYHFEHYGVDAHGWLDYDAISAEAQAVRPRLIVAGASAYSRIIDFARFRAIADSVGALLMVDMAHIAGLVAGGVHPNPVPYADVVTTTTHKTLRGPRGGLILCKQQYLKAINKALFPGIQGGPLDHVIAAKAVALGEAQQPAFKEYAQQVVRNMQAMNRGLVAGDSQLQLVSGGSDNHLVLVDVRPYGLTGREVQNLLDGAMITTNSNQLPDETNGPFKTSGIRLGTAAITTRGFTEDECYQVGQLIVQAIAGRDDPRVLATVKRTVRALTDAHPVDSTIVE
ncbi:serine hydroxymethyltransferase [Lacticaseibacillus thailandensis]|uniref:Serine hydroxymethyltransferase n=1 Tax=Lacticaseibacillus thailandensis DSM 22698 = JCM 13996 TaxID=1423810 RepID=A0A0R2C518_9LACO|nr:serine hydroxymethyltransferase [Lacticaseibacillus thailandensis]KRM86829.1 serine hydroxymethyltransferase [Lacticaseibacillus thailandensis DSM 22698 = JCM 13996]